MAGRPGRRGAVHDDDGELGRLPGAAAHDDRRDVVDAVPIEVQLDPGGHRSAASSCLIEYSPTRSAAGSSSRHSVLLEHVGDQPRGRRNHLALERASGRRDAPATTSHPPNLPTFTTHGAA